MSTANNLKRKFEETDDVEDENLPVAKKARHSNELHSQESEEKNKSIADDVIDAQQTECAATESKSESNHHPQTERSDEHNNGNHDDSPCVDIDDQNGEKQTQKRRRRFVADSDSDDADEHDDNAVEDDGDIDAVVADDVSAQTQKPKFVYGNEIETIGTCIDDVDTTEADAKEHDDGGHDEEEEDDDLDGFVVEEDEDADEELHMQHAHPGGGTMPVQLQLQHYIDSEHNDGEQEIEHQEDDDNDGEQEEDGYGDQEDVDGDDDEDHEDYIDQRRDLRHHNGAYIAQFVDDEAVEVVDDVDDDVEEAEHDDDDHDHEEHDDESEDAGDLCEESDGESLDSMDEQIERELSGRDGLLYSNESTFQQAARLQSMTEMIDAFTQGFNLTREPFFTAFPAFLKHFTFKLNKATRLMSALLPLVGSGAQQSMLPSTSTACLNSDEFLHTLDVDAHSFPNEHAFVQCMQQKRFQDIPSILARGVSPAIVPTFFTLIDAFRMYVVQQWFDSIAYQDLSRLRDLHARFGVPIDLQIPRKLIKSTLSTEFEHLDGATGLVLSAIVNNVDIARFFVQHGADIEYKCKFGNDTALLHAAARGSVDAVRYLCTIGADVDTTTTNSDAYSSDCQVPAAFEALTHCQLQCVECLTYFGADLYLSGPVQSNGTMVSVIHLCLSERSYGLQAIKNGLQRRFELIKQCLRTQFPSDINVENNIATVICEQFLNPTYEPYLAELTEIYDL